MNRARIKQYFRPQAVCLQKKKKKICSKRIINCCVVALLPLSLPCLALLANSQHSDVINNKKESYEQAQAHTEQKRDQQVSRKMYKHTFQLSSLTSCCFSLLFFCFCVFCVFKAANKIS